MTIIKQIVAQKRIFSLLSIFSNTANQNFPFDQFLSLSLLQKKSLDGCIGEIWAL